MKIALIVAALITVPFASAQIGLPPLMSPDRETALAESAAPRAIAEAATIFLLHRGGFVMARSGNNGFTCFVARSAPGEIEPICYEDGQKTHTLVARELMEQQLREKGLDDESVAAEIGQRYRRGELRPHLATLGWPICCRPAIA